MANYRRGATLVLATLLCMAIPAASAESKKEFRYNVAAGASVFITNQYGPVTVKAANGHQVLANATLHSDKVEVDGSQNGNRIELRTHFLQRATDPEGRVDYEVQVPQDASVTIHSSSGPIRVDKLRGDLTVDGDSAKVEVQDSGSGHIHVRTVNGPVTLANITDGHVEITSVSGDVTLNSVSGSKVAVNTTKGNIRYAGDFGSAGDYELMNHSGDIDVTLSASASVEVSARSVSGSVQNDFQFQPKEHTSFASTPGKSLIGTLNAGASAVRLRSFTGKISVHKK